MFRMVLQRLCSGTCHACLLELPEVVLHDVVVPAVTAFGREVAGLLELGTPEEKDGHGKRAFQIHENEAGDHHQ